MNDRPASEVDQQTVARLTGAARWHAHWREPSEAQAAAAAAELRELAGGRGDLLAEVAGLLIGFYRRTVEDPRAQAAAGYCVAAGADQDLIPCWIEVGRRRAAAARRDLSTGPEPGESSAGLPADEAPRSASATGRRLVPHWRSRAGRRPWRTFRYNV